jgi:hypothetical protein
MARLRTVLSSSRRPCICSSAKKGLIRDDYVLRTYPIRLAIYPHEIGQGAVTARRRLMKKETNPVTTPQYRCVSPHGEGSATVPVHVVPQEGWSIVVSTIKYNKDYENNASFTMNTTSPAGFTGTMTCNGFGIVKGPGGIVLDHGSEGVEQGTFSYTETREVPALENAASKTLPIRWGDSVTVPDLPADTETVIFDLHPFTGQNLSLEGAGSNVSFRWVSMPPARWSRSPRKASRRR